MTTPISLAGNARPPFDPDTAFPLPEFVTVSPPPVDLPGEPDDGLDLLRRATAGDDGRHSDAEHTARAVCSGRDRASRLTPGRLPDGPAFALTRAPDASVTFSAAKAAEPLRADAGRTLVLGPDEMTVVQLDPTGEVLQRLYDAGLCATVEADAIYGGVNARADHYRYGEVASVVGRTVAEAATLLADKVAAGSCGGAFTAWWKGRGV